ncbi:olfactory receptor 1L3 [Camelus ferus]|nr:olfactory receptor 1L3 [Camelus ferus]
MLMNFLSKKKTISYAACMTQMYFFLAFANTENYLLAAMAIDRYVAICDPFQYVTAMSHHRCVLLVAFSCSISHLHSLLLVLLINCLLFCDSNVIHHFLCDINPLLKLSCSSTFVSEIIPSAAGKHKAFSTCGSHLTMVTLFYGSIIYVYFRPLSTYTIKDRVATVIYTVLSSMLNPFIYSLRNKDMKRGLRRLMSRRMS